MKPSNHHTNHHTDEHYQTILDSIADGVFTVDLNFRITSFNSAAEAITGISREKALGYPCFQVFKANVCDSGCIVEQTIRAEKPVVNMPIHILRADKKRRDSRYFNE